MTPSPFDTWTEEEQQEYVTKILLAFLKLVEYNSDKPWGGI